MNGAILSFWVPIRMEYMRGWVALLLFAALAAPLVWMGMRSLGALGPVRKWVAIGMRLAVLALIVLILGGIRWERVNTKVEVMVLRDVSASTAQVRPPEGKTLEAALDQYLLEASNDPNKQREDRIGVVSFGSGAQVDAMPNTRLEVGSHAIRTLGGGTDPSAAIQLGLATLGTDAMHRLLLIWDGNATAGDIDSAITAAAAQHVPIDVMPLNYDISNEVLMEKFVAPTLKRENEPFAIDIYLRSTNAAAVAGKLTVFHQGQPMNLGGGKHWRIVTLQPGVNRFSVQVPALRRPGLHQFRAVFEGENVTATVERGGLKQGDTLTENNTADSFTFVRGVGQVLYIDNVPGNNGDLLRQKLLDEGINLARESKIDQFPANIMELQNYDAVVLANVPHGIEGLNDQQQKMLAAYVRDVGGGLVMIGGDQAFGAGAWQGTEVEKVLPVDMDIPGQRQISKGALVLIMHSCEMENGNYWGEQCALKAAEALSSADEIGVISYNWGGPGGGGSKWEYQLQVKGDGTQVAAAIKKMQVGDMPSFEDSMNVALNGDAIHRGLKQSNARQKHVIIISDGDPQRPTASLVRQYRDAKVSVSTVSVYPHNSTATMEAIAKDLLGRHYGPINTNPNQLPQIFIKEAVVVRRSLILEDENGIATRLIPSASDMVKGLAESPEVTGMVLTTRKNSPQVEVPIVAGKNNDPLLATWQVGLGKAAAFTSEANPRWALPWVQSPMFSKFWAQVVRSVSRPPMSTDFDVQTVLNGDKGKITVEAIGQDSGFLNFLSIRGQLVGPDMKPRDVRLVQTGPGVYQAEFDAKEPGNYLVVLNHHAPGKRGGVLLSGVAMNSSPELRDLRGNPNMLEQIAQRTGGRVLPPFDPAGADLFNRAGLQISTSPQPVWDRLIPFLLGLFLLDVAIRRIAWDWVSTKRLMLAGAQRVRDFTTTRKVESRQAIDALKKVKDEVAEQQQKTAEAAGASATVAPKPSARFEAADRGVEGDITQVVGGATDKPVPPPPKKIEPKGAMPKPGEHTGSLLEAKRRAREQIKEKEKGES